jgi:hypothetical protein
MTIGPGPNRQLPTKWPTQYIEGAHHNPIRDSTTRRQSGPGGNG